MAFHMFKDMDLVEQIHIFGVSNIHTFELLISQMRLFGVIFNYTEPLMYYLNEKFSFLICFGLLGILG